MNTYLFRIILSLGLLIIAGLALGQHFGFISGVPFVSKATSAPPVVRQSVSGSSEPLCEWQTIRTLDHDKSAFTQGLVWHDDRLFESTGQYGESTLREVDLDSGKVLRKIDLDRKYFGEGIAILKDQVFQLTWREQRAFSYDIETFKKRKEFSYPGEGWGLTHDGSSLIFSDGTPEIRFINPDTFKEERRIKVVSERGLVTNLNELEYVDGAVLANIWQTGIIVRFDAQTGKVLNWIDTRDILGPRRAPGVMNGIAWIPERKRFLLTGKNWPVLFEVEINCPH